MNRLFLDTLIRGCVFVFLFSQTTTHVFGQQHQPTEAETLQQALGRIQSLELQLSQLQQEVSGAATAPVPVVDPSQAYATPCTCQPCCGRCYQCLCPLEDAPCLECPHVSTLGTKYNIQVFGAMTLDMLYSKPRTVSKGSPFYLLPDSPIGFDQDTVSIHARQSTLGAALTGPQFCGFQAGGLVAALFFNDAIIVDQYGFLPMQAYGELRNDCWRFSAGLQFDVFNPGAPTVLPFSMLSASGNSGNSFRGQIRMERFFNPSPSVQWTIQTALSEPIAATLDPAFQVVAEDNGWPNIEARIALGIGTPDMSGLEPVRPFQLGISGVGGQIRTTQLLTNQVAADVWGIGADLRWQLTSCLGIAGEFYTGQGLGTYGGGILQNINFDTADTANSTGQSIRSTGGWLEAFLYWTPCLHTHVGYGLDDPIDRDLSQTQRSRNSTAFANLIWDVNQSFRIGTEFTYRETEYVSPDLLSNEGPGFHTQFQWSF